MLDANQQLRCATCGEVFVHEVNVITATGAYWTADPAGTQWLCDQHQKATGHSGCTAEPYVHVEQDESEDQPAAPLPDSLPPAAPVLTLREQLNQILAAIAAANSLDDVKAAASAALAARTAPTETTTPSTTGS